MSSIDGQDHVLGNEGKADVLNNNNELPAASRIAHDSENSESIAKEVSSSSHASTADESSGEQEAVVKNSQEIDKSIKSPPIDTSPRTNNSGTTENTLDDQGDAKDSSPTPDESDEWLDILGTGHLKKKVYSTFVYFAAADNNSTIL